MRTFVVLSAVLAYANAGVLLGSPLALTRTVALAPAPIVAPAVTSTQYHAQDELGQFQYGYAGGPSAKSELRTFDGVTRGGYNYIDANGVLQSVSYVADPINGFRVAATNLPVAPSAPEAPQLVGPAPVQDTPEVAAARAAHQKAIAEARARNAEAPAENAEAPAEVAAPIVVEAPQPVQDTPEVAAARAAHQEAHAKALAAALASPE